eukprot:851327_1
MQEQTNSIGNEVHVRSESEICHDLFTEIMEIELIKEIIRNENEYRKYIKQHPSRKNDQRQNRRTQNKDKNEEQKDTSNGPPNDGDAPNDDDTPADTPADDGDDGDDKDEDKDDDNEEDMYSFANIDRMLKKVDRLKQQ